MNEKSSGWLTLIRLSDKNGAMEEMALATVGLIECILPDFYGNAKVRSTGDTAYCERHASIKLPDGGFYDLTGNKLKLKRKGELEVFLVAGKDIPKILEQYFGIYK